MTSSRGVHPTVTVLFVLFKTRRSCTGPGTELKVVRREGAQRNINVDCGSVNFTDYRSSVKAIMITPAVLKKIKCSRSDFGSSKVNRGIILL